MIIRILQSRTRTRRRNESVGRLRGEIGKTLLLKFDECRGSLEYLSLKSSPKTCSMYPLRSARFNKEIQRHGLHV